MVSAGGPNIDPKRVVAAKQGPSLPRTDTQHTFVTNFGMRHENSKTAKLADMHEEGSILHWHGADVH